MTALFPGSPLCNLDRVWFGFCFDLSLDLLKENGFEKLETEFKS